MHSITAEAEFQQYRWLRKHYGVLSRIARRLGCSKQHVSAVYWGKKTSARVVRELRRHGASIGATARKCNV